MRFVARLLLAVPVLGGLVLIGAGLARTLYFEPTGDALQEARAGQRLLLLGCLLLLAATALALRSGPRWAAAAIAVPVLLCGGLSAVAGDTLLPHLAALPAFVVAALGLVGVLVHRPGHESQPCA